jgi:hypothetical protein
MRIARLAFTNSSLRSRAFTLKDTFHQVTLIPTLSQPSMTIVKIKIRPVLVAPLEAHICDVNF